MIGGGNRHVDQKPIERQTEYQSRQRDQWWRRYYAGSVASIIHLGERSAKDYRTGIITCS